MKSSDYARRHGPYDSFAPPRQNHAVMFLQDGAEHFAEVHRAISAARFRICITDWWLSPDLPLLRPAADHAGEAIRIHDLLRSKAEQGVQIFINVFAEIRQLL